MAETHLISGLTAKRAELAGRIKQLNGEIQLVQEQLDMIDGAIKIFDPDYDLRGIKPRITRKPNEWFGNGELHRLVLDVMREAKSPVTVRGIFDGILVKKGFNEESVDDRAITKAIDKRLRGMEKDSTVMRSGIDENSGANLWKIH